MQAKHPVTRGNVLRHYRKLLRGYLPQHIEQAAVWYIDAQAVAQAVADNLGASLEIGAAIVAAFSPRERWTINVSKALAFSQGREVKGLGVNIRTANVARTDGFKALRGPKTLAFGRAIAGDSDAIVIDVWMMRGAGVTKDSPTASQYTLISDCVRQLAEEWGLTPRTMQALIWVLARGSAY